MLQQDDLHLFQQHKVALPQGLVTLYKKLHLLVSGRIIVIPSKTTMALRDNSGIIYINGDGQFCYGQLNKILFFDYEHQSKCYVVISELQRGPKKLCKDLVTNAGLNDHIVSLKKPRLELKPIQSC